MPKFFLNIFRRKFIRKRFKSILCCLLFSNDYQTKKKEVFLEQIKLKDESILLPYIFIEPEDKAEEIRRKFKYLACQGKTIEGQYNLKFIMNIRKKFTTGDKINKKLTDVDLSGNKIRDSGAKYLAEQLKANKTLKRINISRNEIEDSGAEALAEALKTNTTLTEIDLSENKIGASGAKELADILTRNKTLEKINLWKNEIGEGAKYLAEALKSNKTLKTINLSENKIGDSGAKKFAEALKINTTLTKINLSENGIGESGAENLAEALVNKNGSSWGKALTIKINLSSNKIGVKGAKKLAEVLKTNTRLKKINLSGNEIEDSVSESLAEALKKNTTLTEIDLSENKIGGRGAKELAKALKDNKTLEKINLSGNEIGVLGAKEFATALQFNETLTQINLGKCEIGFTSKNEIEESKSANLLKSPQSLKIPDHQETNTLLHSNSKLPPSEFSFHPNNLQDKASKETNEAAQKNKEEEDFYAFIINHKIPLLEFSQNQFSKADKLGHSIYVFKGSYLNSPVVIKEYTNFFDSMNKKMKNEPNQSILHKIQKATSLDLPFNHCIGISLKEEDRTLYSVHKLALNDSATKLKEDPITEHILCILHLLDTDKIVHRDLQPKCDNCTRRKIQSEDSFDFPSPHSPYEFCLNYSEICTLGVILHEIYHEQKYWKNNLSEHENSLSTKNSKVQVPKKISEKGDMKAESHDSRDLQDFFSLLFLNFIEKKNY